jgi:hypothetical protein
MLDPCEVVGAILARTKLRLSRKGVARTGRAECFESPSVEWNPDHLELLREWLQTANGPRRSEALATLNDEGCRHEQAYLIEDVDSPAIIYVMEVEDAERSKAVAAQSIHPIDAEHRRVMGLALGDDVPAELLLDLIKS